MVIQRNDHKRTILIIVLVVLLILFLGLLAALFFSLNNTSPGLPNALNEEVEGVTGELPGTQEQSGIFRKVIST